MIELEKSFNEALEDKDFEQMYLDIHFCCENILKKLLTGFPKRLDFDEIVDEAALKCFGSLKEHLKKDPNYKVEKLVNFCFKPSYFTLRNPKRAAEDALMSLDELNEAGVQISSRPELEEELENEKEVLSKWTIELKNAAIEALQKGSAKLKKPSNIDLSDVKEMTVLAVTTRGDCLTLKSAFGEN